jgi:hypothetical protein
MTKRILATALLCAAPALAADDVVMRAMRDELARSMKKLQLENLQKPYFIAYRAVESSGCNAAASFGALVTSNCEPPPEGRARSRQLSVEVRVGDYSRDNSSFYAPQLASAGVTRVLAPAGMSVPVDDNYDEIRRQLWLATDSGYKNALDLYAKKKAALENRTRTDDAPDFSKEPPVTDSETAKSVTWNRAEIDSLVKALSMLFRQTPAIDHSEVRFSATNWTTRYVNSEGTSFIRETPSASIVVTADTQAVDGMPLTDFEATYGRSMEDLASRDEMTRRIHALAARLETLRKAPVLEKYTGPVLFEGQAAGEIVAQGFANALLGMPRIVVDDMRFAAAFNSNDRTLFDKIGSRVLPDSLSVVDNPAAHEFHGQPLLGGYQVDEDGVKAGPTQLIGSGILKTLLHTRALIPGTTASTGSRRGPWPMPSNLLITSEKGMPPAQLKAELIRMAKQRGSDYGVVIRRIGNPMTASTLGRSRIIIITSRASGGIDVEPAIEAYKVYADGHEELVRNFNITNLMLSSFKDIAAASDSSAVYTLPFRPRLTSPVITGFLGPNGPNLLSIATPSLLFDDLSLQRPSGEVPNLPFSKHPSFDK